MGKRVDLSAKPYGLSAEQIRWVEDTLAKLSDEEKVGQLFVNLFFLGADTFSGNRWTSEEILHELGYSDEQIEVFRRQGALG